MAEEIRVDRNLYLTADRDELVEEGDARAAFAWAREGSTRPKDEADRLGYKAKSQPANKAKAAPTEDKAADAEESHICDVCGFEAKTAGGLASHQRSHEDD